MRIEPGFAEEALRLARKSGADQAEIYIRRSREITAESKGGRTDALESSTGFGYGVRVIKSGRLGFSFSNDPAFLESTVKSSIEGAAFTAEDAYLGLPSLNNQNKTLDTFDESVDEVTAEQAIASAAEIEAAALAYDRRITKLRKAAASFSSSETLIANTEGVMAGWSSTMCVAHVSSVAEEGGDSQSGWGYGSSRRLAGVDFRAVGAEAALRAASMLHAERMRPMKAKVIIESSVAAELLGLLSAMLSSEAVQKGKSLLAGMLGQRIMSAQVDIVDDGLVAESPACRPYDDEGVAVSRNELVTSGILRKYMFNTYTARKGSANSTGNAVRGGAASLPGVGPIALGLRTSGDYLEPLDMVRMIDQGLYVTNAMGIHTINPISGDFSIGVSGKLILSGAYDKPAKEAVISGNILELFGSIIALGSDIRHFGSISSPSILVDAQDISA